MESTKPIVILLVEDSPTARFQTESFLRSQLACEYELLQADCRQVAYDLLHQHGVDLVLLDLNLPDSQGLTTFTSLQPKCQRAAVVIVSGESDQQTAITAVRMGAQDYVVKGASFTAELLGRTVQFAIERNARQLAENELASVRHDLEIADSIQQRLYPVAQTQLPCVDVAGRCESATENCGDYFDYIVRPDGSFLVVIGDVSGHGIGPAMMMVQTRAVLRALAATQMPLDQIVTLLNRFLSDDMQGQLFVTLFVASLDPGATSLQFVSAGQPGYLVRQEGPPLTLQTDNLPLGVEAEECYHTECFSGLLAGDLLVLFTDGLSEATADHISFLGDRCLVDKVSEVREQTPEAILDSMFDLAKRFNNGIEPQDDRTGVVMRMRPSTECTI